MRTIPMPAAAVAPPQKGGVSRGVWIAAGVALVLIASGVGIGVGLGLPHSKSNSSSSSKSNGSASGAPSGTPSSITNGTTTTAAPSSGADSTTAPPSFGSSNGTTSDPSAPPPAASPPGSEALNITELPLAIVDQFIELLNGTAEETQNPNWLALIELIEDNRHMFLLYLRARKLNEVIAYLQAVRSDADGITPADREQARDALLSTINFTDFRRWLRANDRSVPKLTSKQLADLKALEPYIDEAIIAEYGNDTTTTSSGPDLRDPVVQLTQFAERLKAAGLDFTNLLNPEFYTAVEKSGVGGRKMKAAAVLPPVGFSWFQPKRMGLVFHVMQFPNGTAFFPGTSPAVRASFTYLVDAANRFYMLSGVNIQFYIKGVRLDPTEYPYLEFGSLSAWQTCAQQRQDCLCQLALDNNVEPDTYVNVWVSGFLFLMQDEAVLAYSSSLPPVLDTCAGALAATATITTTSRDDAEDPTSLAFNPETTPPAQHIWMAYDNLRLLTVYNRSRYDDGGATLAHELGHFLGLMHTHDSGCVATDFVVDTPPNLLIDSQPWAYKALSPWCRALRAGTPVNNSVLAAFDSCPRDDTYIDNVFNLMSYSPASCSLLFTLGQVQRMQRIATVYRKQMLQVP